MGKKATASKGDDQKNRRLTNQRLVILEYIRQRGNHSTAEEVFTAVKDQLPDISFATVYRNLNFLSSRGQLREVVINKISRFEDRVDAHAHLICAGCDRVFEADDDSLFVKARRLAKKNKFTVSDENIEFRGYCATCEPKYSDEINKLSNRCPACGKLQKEIEKGIPDCAHCRVRKNCRYFKPDKIN